MSFTYDEAVYLIKKGIITKDSGIVIKGLSKTNNDEYRAYKFFDCKDSVKFNIIDEKRRNILVKQSAILKVDGMDPHKLYEVYKSMDGVIRINEKTDINNDIIGKDICEIYGYKVNDNDKIIFENDITKKNNNKLYVIKNVGKSIKLVPNRGRPKSI